MPLQTASSGGGYGFYASKGLALAAKRTRWTPTGHARARPGHATDTATSSCTAATTRRRRKRARYTRPRRRATRALGEGVAHLGRRWHAERAGDEEDGWGDDGVRGVRGGLTTRDL